jgi:hypothetical protein
MDCTIIGGYVAALLTDFIKNTMSASLDGCCHSFGHQKVIYEFGIIFKDKCIVHTGIIMDEMIQDLQMRNGNSGMSIQANGSKMANKRIGSDILF